MHAPPVRSLASGLQGLHTCSQGDWPKLPVVSAYDVVEKGGFVWLFNGPKSLPADARPPIPYVPELDDPKCVCHLD